VSAVEVAGSVARIASKASAVIEIVTMREDIGTSSYNAIGQHSHGVGVTITSVAPGDRDIASSPAFVINIS
jgi:hypothetical protein